MARERSSGSGRRRGSWLILLGLVVLVAWLGWLAFKGSRVAAHLDRIKMLAGEAQQFGASDGQAALASSDNLGALCDRVMAIESELDGLAREGEIFLNLAPFLAWAPRYGYDLQSVPQLLSMVRETLSAGLVLCEIGQRTLPQIDLGSIQSPAVVRIIQEQRGRFRLAREKLDGALALRAGVDDWRLSAVLAEPVARFDRLIGRLAVASRAAELAPSLLGADRGRTYLILAQNEDELRPTGGFISAAGHVRLENGYVTEMNIADSYSFDDFSKPYPWPPYPLYEYMGADYWLLRDANWSPDFPTAAETAAALYLLSTGVEVDGVIALDQVALQYFLEGIGPVEVAEESGGVWVSAENLTMWMQNNWAPAPGQVQDRAWWAQRKSFVSELAAALLKRVQGGTGLGPISLMQAILRALEEKHLLIYDRHPEAAQLLYDLGWDGHIDRSAGDYFMAVEANVSFNKASGRIGRSLNYSISLNHDGSGDVTVELRYEHRGNNPVDFCDPTPRYDAVYSAMMDRCYWNYLRLIVPAGAELLSFTPVTVPGAYLLRGRPSDDGIAVEKVNDMRQSWGQLFLLAPGENAALKYSYRLPAGAARHVGGHWRYRLVLQKQPGLRALPVSLKVRLPEGMKLLGGNPRPDVVEGQSLRYDLELSGDQVIKIDYGP